MPDISRKAWPMDVLPSILKITKKGFYHWKGFLLLKKVSVREYCSPGQGKRKAQYISLKPSRQ